ncbi:MAG TPA: hypothetical protein VMV05_11210 [bacterium]|nr:hypothetical protein [bacterium]
MALPGLLFCHRDKNILSRINSKGKADWDYEADGPLVDVQPQPSGQYLVTGGPQKVFLLQRVWRGFQVPWGWEKLEGVSIRCVVGSNWDDTGNPTLVLAADAKNSRVFLADAKSRDPKIRWEFKLPSPPLVVRVCPDSNNFLVLLENSTVEEIQYQEDKVVWSMGKEDGLVDVRDAIRGPWGHTFVAEGKEGLILCFDPGKKLVWKTHLPFAPSPAFQEITLTTYKKKKKRTLMAAVHWGEGPARNVLYLLNAETGKVMGWSDKPQKGSYPDFRKAVPDLAPYGHP